MSEKTIAILLAAGRGKRMNSTVHKQYLLIQEKPVLYYSLKALEDSFVEHIVLVVGAGEAEYCRKQIVQAYGFQKVSCIVEGGSERYHSVWNGLNAIRNMGYADCDYVMIHDGARPFLNKDILERSLACVKECNACAAGMPSKDTVKIVNKEGICMETPNRDYVWNVQTPQSFSYELISRAYQILMEQEGSLRECGIKITDDAMVVETFTEHSVKMTEGTYQNIKITTPEDLGVAEAFLRAEREG